MSDLFGAVEGQMVGVDEKGNTKLSRTDLKSYETYLDGVAAQGPGFEARLVVPTGEPVLNRKGQRTGRGKIEARHDRAFRTVASARNIGIRIVPERLTDGTTMLRIALTEKRTFENLTIARRDRGRINYQAIQAAEKANKAKLSGSPDAAELLKKANDLIAQVKKLDADIAAMNGGEAPATPKPPARQGQK